MKSCTNYLFVAVIVVFTTVVAGRDARADVVYRATSPENNYVPFGEDGTPGRPVPGDKLGNTITLGGTNRSLDRITVDVALNNAAGSPDPAMDTWTLDLYVDDGPVDPKSGLGQPGTIIGSASTAVSMPPFSTVPVVFDFTAAGLVVPDTFIVIVSSTHPVDTFFTGPGVAGPYSSAAPPTIGSGPNTMWYTSAASVWETNHTWAIADGATTNYASVTVEASP